MSGPSAVSCPACGGTIEVRAAGYTVTLACQHCGSLLDTTRPEVTLITAYKRAAKSFALTLGARGTLFDIEWQVIGALKRRSPESGTWQEFLLFNPYAGYRWLVLVDGTWQFGTMLLDRPEDGPRAVQWRGQDYGRGDSETITTVTVLGEFYWQVARGDEVGCTTFQRGAEVLSCESTGDETTWTQLVTVEESAVGAAFAIDRKFVPRPPRPSAGARFMGSRGMHSDDLPMMFLVALAALSVIGLVQLVLRYPQVCARSNTEIVVGAPTRTHRIGTIEARRPWQFVTIAAAAGDFTNRWVDLDYTLVNRQTQQSIDAYGIVEYYVGTDSDGPWSEGSHTAETLFASVPRGTYDVYVDVAAHGWPNDPVVQPTTSATTTTSSEAPGTGSWDSTPATTTSESASTWYAPPETQSVWFTACTGGFSRGMFWLMGILLFTLPGLVLWWRHRGD